MTASAKPSHSEDEYFSRQEVEKMRRLSKEVKERFADKERETLKQIHWMHCPRCGLDLQTINFQGFLIEKCFDCGCVCLDNVEFEKLAGKEEGFVSSIIGIFK